MARDFFISGETLVRVKGSTNGALQTASVQDLGLAEEGIVITPRFVRKEIFIDEFGPEIPVELMSLLADVTVSMTLIQFDPVVLDACLSEAMGGPAPEGTNTPGNYAGIFKAAGSMLGRNSEIFENGCHYISLNLLSPVLNYPWRFFTSTLTDDPVSIPLGTKRSAVALKWRCIPYQLAGNDEENDTSASNGIWDHELDT